MTSRHQPAGAHAPARGLTAPDRRGSDRVPTPGLACSMGDVLDLSPTGLRVRTHGEPGCSVGERLDVIVRAASGSFVVTVRPVWIRPAGRSAFEVGAAFEDLTERARARILALVREFAGEPRA